VVSELSRLSQENSLLRAKLSATEKPLDLGFTYDELIDVLENKNLLQLIFENRFDFVGSYGYPAITPDEISKMHELQLLNLVEPGNRKYQFFFTEYGKKFITKYQRQLDLYE
jgi:hypothetical protein